jgi:TRAP-type mannitol/chloroaromatic compound transport system substrate-binding protein
MKQLLSEHGIDMRPLPDDVIQALKLATAKVIEQKRAEDPSFDKVYASYDAFYKDAKAYHKISEQAYYENRE